MGITPNVSIQVLEVGSHDALLTLLVFPSWISRLQRFGEVTFDSLVSREANRATAAHTLYKLLGEHARLMTIKILTSIDDLIMNFIQTVIVS